MIVNRNYNFKDVDMHNANKIKTESMNKILSYKLNVLKKSRFFRFD